MIQKNLLASVALFGQLYNSDKYSNISAIIADFIKGGLILQNKFSLTSYEIKNLLRETYDFDIPESVVKTVIYSNFKDKVEIENKIFSFHESIKEEFKDVDKELDEKNLINEEIFSRLKNYISEVEKVELNAEDKAELFDNFNQFLFENGSTDRYSNYISSFVIKNESDVDFVKNLNEIREGLILYQGIRFTANINELGTWKTNLVIYLNTEYLFSALGYNGLLFREIFDDFYGLVCEINNADEKKISLKYFSETEDEIESFFTSAESILKGQKRLMPWKTAMKEIVESCKTPSDIIAKKVGFYQRLEQLEIELQEFEYNIDEYPEYNVVDEKVIEKMKKISVEKKKRFDEDSCYYFFNMFTKVNFFRQGANKKPFSRIGHIFISDSGFAKYLGHNNSVKFDDGDTTFAKDIDFVTTQFWIKLKKGFSEKSEFPKSFNVLTKARIIIASHIHNSMSKEFDQLVSDTEKGIITKEEALARSYALREKPNLPSEINSENIDSTFDFLNNENYLADVYREKVRKEELLSETQQRNIELQKEIERRDKIDKEREEKERLGFVAKRMVEKKKAYESELTEYKSKMDDFCEIKWTNLLKESKKHFWRYLQFIIVTILLIFILVSFRDRILNLLNIQITDEIKLYYSGLIMVIGFIATTIRSFFDTKNIIKGLKIIFNNKFRREFKEIHLMEFEERYRVDNEEPVME